MNVGIILNNLESSQLNFLALNQVPMIGSAGHSPFLFYESISVPCMVPKTACMNISQAYRFDGTLIATNLNQISLISNFLNSGEVIYYVWDLEWLRNKQSFLRNVSALRNDKIVLIARSEDHAKAIENYCNRKPNFVVSNFNILHMVDLCNSQKKMQK